MRLPDIRNVFDTSLWLPITTAASVVDTLGLFVWRYTSKPGSPINKWYDKFGLAAYSADVLSIIIGVVLTQLATTWLGGAWNPLTFCVVAVIIQLVHDITFGNVIVPAVPRGHNAVMDLMKEYVGIDFPQGILIVDALYMIFASLLTMYFASVPSGYSWMTLLVTWYSTTYVLFTRPSN
jgi:hypothetical protein